ncbi:transposase [Variovorax brevis]|uniref:transposase n=1 Tax=Variovorax brevis TaxID=3053503 RepID=UPI004038062B
MGDIAVKRSRFTEEQICVCLEAGGARHVDDICRKMGISDATFYKWRQRPAMLLDAIHLAAFVERAQGDDPYGRRLQRVTDISASGWRPQRVGPGGTVR